MSVLQISTWVLQERTALDIYLRSPGADCTRYLPEFSRNWLHQISTWVLQELTVPDIYLSSPGIDCTRYLPEFTRNWLHQISTWFLQELTVPDIYLSSPGTDCTRYLPDPRGITVNPVPNTFNFFVAIKISSVDISWNNSLLFYLKYSSNLQI